MVDPALRCAHFINQSEFIVALTGAGISTNAGIPDFRGPQGLYTSKHHDPNVIFDIQAFRRDPKPFFNFARDYFNLEQKVKPTFTHEFLAKLESCGKIKGVITQNIDSLHQMGGSINVLEVHGSFGKSTCLGCGHEYSYERTKSMISTQEVALCSCGGVIKPNIVFFGENVHCMEAAADLVARADLFFIIGTSCVVYPAAMLPEFATGKIIVVSKGKVGINLPNIAMKIDEDIDQFFRKVAYYV
jgi:NAD-dependent deacetylase